MPAADADDEWRGAGEKTAERSFKFEPARSQLFIRPHSDGELYKHPPRPDVDGTREPACAVKLSADFFWGGGHERPTVLLEPLGQKFNLSSFPHSIRIRGRQ